ncbi:hypothetical protein C7451_101253 [Blastomonas natatoria]|uniref:Uncharacterized protein n=1 Tax=Blastomonas natatoria TaxID=34015 RepID=A0A2V3VRM9_9SPHN|nr:hypothetical protein [Blastomonas natatoria]PXW79189.1 hypothetical protein C7451_101253 [Blastomonas natatoria]
MPRTYSERQSSRTTRMVAITLGLALVALAAKAGLLALGIDDAGWVALGFILIGFAAVFLLGLQFWKGLDDFQRQGHAVSTYWGNIGGLAVTACIIAGAGLARSEFVLGVATLAVTQLGCSLILYGHWRLKARGLGFRAGE